MGYVLPHQLHDALRFIAGTEACVIAGGTDVYPAMQPGRTPPTFLDVTRIEGFDRIGRTAEGVRFGAAVTWSDVFLADLPPAFAALKQAAREVGGLQIQNAGTLAGNICNASPAADSVPPLLALDAEVEIASATRGVRRMPLADFITGVRQTVLQPDELVTALHIPPPPEGMTASFEKLGSRKYLVISIVMTAANIVLDTQGRIATARIAVGACSAVAHRLTALEADLIGQDPARVEIAPEHLAQLAPIDDVRGTGAYRRAAASEQIARAIGKAAQ